MNHRKPLAALAATLTIMALAGCSDASTASYNLSNDSDNFKVARKIVFFNGITDKYLLSIEGYCSIHVDRDDHQLEVTCKTGKDEYRKHFLGLSDNVTYFVEQVDDAHVSKDHYKVVLKPETVLPEFEMR
ncbi:hypothetical protein [Bifidobacterium tibiigranuli]|jgi:hypothetical protein|uniref:beta-sandwich lipoprotein n=1 Tax=Bifidobacterium tibiigranuli TaxID=2172043 RepID=UPI0023566516|nr:hypothetical protein [Bifidobacterium tibiigranuli]MCH3975053.1 hypothetical protein [Bifidobacterium tibiigranuli]MCH4202813.1 hypothetical protein [Bifidobacterium tibiigranuli]MCH4274935.1 hypothetical protein [Bifidobacterium tibiigranuli]MCI1211022.1 hypothetical protein [Bifidobacterium tibiigranuli]MCI1221787.1 hypothetical protein [Bifidobacterium tibiigranuli]